MGRESLDGEAARQPVFGAGTVFTLVLPTHRREQPAGADERVSLMHTDVRPAAHTGGGYACRRLGATCRCTR
jgi:hypothetical protein